jgi:hypothetical protein
VEELLMEEEFAGLQSAFTMLEANRRLKKFMQRLNNKDPNLLNIIS